MTWDKVTYFNRQLPNEQKLSSHAAKSGKTPLFPAVKPTSFRFEGAALIASYD